jgi:hypothetical protein
MFRGVLEGFPELSFPGGVRRMNHKVFGWATELLGMSSIGVKRGRGGFTIRQCAHPSA